MLANIAKLSLLSLVLPATVLASSHGHLLNRNHNDLAKRHQSANESALERRGPNSRWSFYNVETGNAGSCGAFHVNSDYTVAMNAAQMNSGWCNKQIKMTYNGKTTTVPITDTCPGCPYGGLDLTEGLFQFFAPSSVGIIYGDWEFVDASPAPTPTPTPTPPPPPKTTSKWIPPISISIWTPPTTTSHKPTPTSTSTTSTSTSKTSTSTKASSTSTTHTPSTSTTPTTSIDYSTGPASGLAVPTGTINETPGTAQNVANMYQAFIQVGGLIAGAANN
jgi:hypothetical protein